MLLFNNALKMAMKKQMRKKNPKEKTLIVYDFACANGTALSGHCKKNDSFFQSRSKFALPCKVVEDVI